MRTPTPLHSDNFEAIVEAVPGVVLVAHDPRCRQITGNAAACLFFRVAPGTNLSRWQPSPAATFRLRQNGAELPPEQTPLQRAARGEILADYDVDVCFDDGTVRYLRGNAMPLLDENGRATGAVAAYADMIERRRAEQALRGSEERLRSTLEAARVGAWHWDLASGAVQWSGNLEGIHHMEPGASEADSDVFLERIHADDRERVLATIDQALIQGGRFRVEYREAASGSWIEGRGEVECGQTGQPTGIIGVALDVTERKRAEGALRESEERLRYTLESSRVGTWRWDVATGAVEWSDNLESLYGRPSGSFDGTFEAFLAGVHPDDREAVTGAIQSALAGEADYAIEHRVARADGQIGWLECRGRVERDAAGEPVRMTGICMDVTERKHAGESLRALAEAGTTLATALDYDSALDQVAEVVVPGWGDWCAIDVLHDDGELETVTVAHADSAKAEHARELRREYPARLDAPTGVGYVVRTGQSLCRKIDETELAAVAADQRHLELLRELGLRSAVIVPLIARGRTLGALTLVTAETARDYADAELPNVQELGRRCAFAVDNARLYRESQRELKQRRRTEGKLKRLNETLEQRVSERTALAEQRAAQLRGLASELAHAEQRERRRLAQALHDDHQQVLVAAKLQVGMLQQSSVPDAEELTQLDELLDEAVQSARLVSRELSPAVLYDGGLAAALRWLAMTKNEKYGLTVHVEADETADPEAEDVSIFLYQAVRELLLNTVKHADTCEAWVSMTLAGDNQVQINVIDQGCGFDQERLLDEGADAGQFGLFGMRERLALLDGTVDARSAPGDGTRVTMFAPRGGGGAQANRTRVESVDEPTAVNRDAIRVVLADDHKMLRDGLAGLLRAEPDIELVAEADDGKEAQAIAERLRPDIVVMDISMPGVSGIEATRRLRQTRPGIAVVGLSMHDSKEMAEAMCSAGAAVYLSKDGAASTLVEAIRTHGRSAPDAG